MGLSDLVKPSDWDQESYPDSTDFRVLPFLAVFFFLLRFILDRFFFERLAARLITRQAHHKLDQRRKKIVKFKESAWKFLYTFSAEILALYVTCTEPWFTDTRHFWLGPEDQVWPDLKLKLKLKVMYTFAGGFYVYSFFALFLWETRRSDFKVMLAHHITTLLLLVLSYTFRFARIGSVIMAIHDVSDVFLETAKMSKYSGAEAIASFCFIIFALSWTGLRLVYFPSWVLWSTSYEVISILDGKKEKKELQIYYYVFNTLLYCLLVLHIYWWVLICRMVFRQIRGNGRLTDDVRSDSEGEDHEHED
ncbi:PREDICTED: LAG1 longevity assurance homolog 3 [Tarenaya hassleriana]|uniref:LAG1 longevity assurance homolog 3 n=1 Tax=Tarenaya hassleriana TaxID=28532 RepID=UPI00053C725A|nr:PREDICTED: LAG1 longevity assurance homolog 3 [Tarenaya hassleriana]XP_019059036.1 PREDICTED: LAG1 longevity assurance homolog 3 [Tarenaya hassleriana]XP_019059037.1 PREDICTED: LAG1 longevity assurance homolog 3 [Tarenaya hassleriana]